MDVTNVDINVSKLDKGLYIVKIFLKDEVLIRKIIKE